MPCIDSLHDRCTWDIHGKIAHGRDYTVSVTSCFYVVLQPTFCDTTVTTEEEMIVVASGELVEKTLTTVMDA